MGLASPPRRSSFEQRAGLLLLVVVYFTLLPSLCSWIKVRKLRHGMSARQLPGLHLNRAPRIYRIDCCCCSPALVDSCFLSSLIPKALLAWASLLLPDPGITTDFRHISTFFRTTVINPRLSSLFRFVRASA